MFPQIISSCAVCWLIFIIIYLQQWILDRLSYVNASPCYDLFYGLIQHNIKNFEYFLAEYWFKNPVCCTALNDWTKSDNVVSLLLWPFKLTDQHFFSRLAQLWCNQLRIEQVSHWLFPIIVVLNYIRVVHAFIAVCAILHVAFEKLLFGFGLKPHENLFVE